MNDLVINTVARNFLTKIATALLVWLGGIIIAHGFATESDVQQAIDPIAQIIAGALMTGASVLIIWIRSLIKRQKELGLLASDGIAVTVKGGSA